MAQQTQRAGRCSADTRVRHVYIHIPFCDGKCRYCSFYSVPIRPALADRYLGALRREIGEACKTATVQPYTIYVGGGTPAILGADRLDRLCEIVRSLFDLSCLREWTVEANPGTVTADKLSILKRSGVNRISLGVQSFSDDVLRRLGRRHAVADTVAAAELIRLSGIPHFSVDLIAAVPGLSDRKWQDELDRAVALKPDHVSVYTLTIEPGTRLERMVARGSWPRPDPQLELRRLHATEKLLARHGFRRYEVSNYARPHCECSHNTFFWLGGDYLGFGPAAASRTGRSRWINSPDVKAYCKALAGAGSLPPRNTELLSPETDAAERVAFAFRLLRNPVRLDHYAREVPHLLPAWLTAAGALVRNGLLRHTTGGWRVTARGADFADTIAASFLNA